MPGLEVTFGCRAGKTVPRADNLAVIAPKHPVADHRAQLFRDRSFQLNGQVRNALARIQHVWPDKGIGGANIQASGASPAMLGFVRLVHRQRQVDKQFTQEEVATRLAIEHQGVFANPAQPGFLCDGFFQHRGAVDKGAKAKRADLSLNTISQVLHALANQLVVIAPQRVARHVSFLRLGQQLRHVRVTGQVVHAQGNHPQGAGHQFVGV